MKVFFAGAGGVVEEMRREYGRIMGVIRGLGHELVVVYDPSKAKAERGGKWVFDGDDFDGFYRRVKKLLVGVDVVVLEASIPASVNIGLLAATLTQRGKPVVCLYKKGKKPVFADGVVSGKLIKAEYGSDVRQVVEWALEEAEKLLSRRFTFFIDGEIEAFLDQVVKERRVSRSEYIRGLIEREMGRGSRK